MLRKLTTTVLATAALSLALAGCSSKSDTAQLEASTADSAGVVVEEEVTKGDAADKRSEKGLTDSEACEVLTDAAMELADKGLELLENPDDLDPQDSIDLQLAFLEVIKDVGERAASDEFREKALRVYELGLVRAEFDYRLQIEKDTTVELQEALDASDEYFDAYTELVGLCSPQ